MRPIEINITLLDLNRPLGSATYCYKNILIGPTPLRSRSCFSQSLCTPTVVLAPLLRVTEVPELTYLEFSIFFDERKDAESIILKLITVEFMGHGRHLYHGNASFSVKK